MSQGLFFISAKKSEIGRRPTNDDCVLIDETYGLYVLCDGAKGKHGGRTAGEITCEVIRELLPTIGPRLRDSTFDESEHLIEEMVLQAHQRILQAQEVDPSLAGMTTTLALLLHRDNRALISHAGDSRVYCLRGGTLEQLTRDHNLHNYLEDNPHFKPKVNLSGKTLVRAVGLKSSSGLKLDHLQLEVRPTDRFLLTSDGLTDSLPPLTIMSILNCAELTSLEEVGERLVRAALSHGSMDNISVVLLEATDSPLERSSDGQHTAIYDVDAITGHTATMTLGWIYLAEGTLKGTLFSLEGSTVIGAEPGCKVVICEEFVSSRHLEILHTEHGYIARDLHSTNGTFINNIRITEESLVDGDLIRIGATEIVFKQHRYQL